MRPCIIVALCLAFSSCATTQPPDKVIQIKTPPEAEYFEGPR